MIAPVLLIARKFLIEEVEKPYDHDEPIGLLGIVSYFYRDVDEWWDTALVNVVLECCERELKEDKRLTRLYHLRIPPGKRLEDGDLPRLLHGLDELVEVLVRGTTVRRFAAETKRRLAEHAGESYIAPALGLLSATLVDYAHGRMTSTPAGRAFADFILSDQKAVREALLDE